MSVFWIGPAGRDLVKDSVYGIIYKVTNIINQKVYIGQTVQTLHKRRIRHESGSRKRNTLIHFHRALKKHSFEKFKWEVLEYCHDKTELDDLEYHYILQFNSYKNGYNQTFGGEGSCGRVCTESTKKRISKGKTGIPLSEKHKVKLSIIRSGAKKSVDHVNKVAEANSKFWKITYPNGKKEIIRNLSSFCREYNLSDRGMWLVANKYRTHHKGFICALLEA